MPGPLLRPFETVRPEVSECSRIPASWRPVSSAATPWAPSWAIVTRCRLRAHSSGTEVTANASTPVASTSPSDGGGATTESRSHRSGGAEVTAPCCQSGARWQGNTPRDEWLLVLRRTLTLGGRRVAESGADPQLTHRHPERDQGEGEGAQERDGHGGRQGRPGRERQAERGGEDSGADRAADPLPGLQRATRCATPPRGHGGERHRDVPGDRGPPADAR